jgi:hypothetical protein
MRGRPRLNPDHVLSNAERVRRWREKHGKLPAPKPPKPEAFPDNPERQPLPSWLSMAG